MMDHSGKYLESGAHDSAEVWADQDSEVCEKSLTYLLDGEVGVRTNFPLESFPTGRKCSLTFEF